MIVFTPGSTPLLRGIRMLLCLVSTAAVAFVLAGCGEDEYKKPAKTTDYIDSLPPAPASSVTDTVPIPALPSTDLREDLGISTQRYGSYSNRDLRDKADIFWKFYWMTKELQEGRTPASIQSELDAIEQAIKKFTPDKNVASLTAILKQVHTGLEARDLAKRLSSSGVSVASIGWSGGEYDVSKHLTHPTDGPANTLRSAARLSSADARDAAAWAGRHHKSPVQVEQESFRQATDLTNALGDTLDDERREAGEHLLGRENVVPGAGMGNPYESMFPSDPIR